MKTCPICGARAFDDAEVCYGCLHRFSDDMPARSLERSACGTPSFLIRLRLVSSGRGEYRWSCEIESDDEKSPEAA